MEALVEASYGYVCGIVSSVEIINPNLLDLEDLRQAGVIGLMSAAKSYKPDQDTTFKTWAYYRILGSARDLVRSANPQSRTRNSQMLPLDEIGESELSSDGLLNSVVDSVMPDTASVLLLKQLQGLTLRQRSIVVLLLNGLKSRHIASLFDMSLSQVQADRKSALEYLTSKLSSNLNGNVPVIS